MAQLEILSLYNYEQIPYHRKYVQKHLCAKMLGLCFFFFNILQLMAACGRKCRVACSFSENYVTDWHKYFNNIYIKLYQPDRNVSTYNTIKF